MSSHLVLLTLDRIVDAAGLHAMGSGLFGWRMGSWMPAAASLILHVIYGAILGGVYVPPL